MGKGQKPPPTASQSRDAPHVMTGAEVLKDLRNASGMSQQELAVAIGASVSTVSLTESGHRKMSYDMALRLSQALNVPPWLLCFLDSYAQRSSLNRREPLFEDLEDEMYDRVREIIEARKRAHGTAQTSVDREPPRESTKALRFVERYITVCRGANLVAGTPHDAFQLREETTSRGLVLDAIPAALSLHYHRSMVELLVSLQSILDEAMLERSFTRMEVENSLVHKPNNFLHGDPVEDFLMMFRDAAGRFTDDARVIIAASGQCRWFRDIVAETSMNVERYRRQVDAVIHSALKERDRFRRGRGQKICTEGRSVEVQTVASLDRFAQSTRRLYNYVRYNLRVLSTVLGWTDTEVVDSLRQPQTSSNSLTT